MKLKTIALAALASVLGLTANTWAGLALDQDRLEFGNIKEGVKAQKVVVVTNSGPESLKIANITTSCSCTSTAIGQRELQPGQSTELKIVYNTWKFPGKFEKYVTLYSGPKGKTKNVITMVGFVEKAPMGVLTVDPRKVTVGKLALGRETVRELKIRNTGDAALSITKVVSKKFKTVYLEAAKNNGPLEIKPGAEAVVEMALKPTKAGRYLDYVMIHGQARNITEKGYKVVVVGEAE